MPCLLKECFTDEGGQRPTEDLLVVALIALATITGMQNAAGEIASAFNTLGNKPANYLGT